jgi:dsRNA-specific ribonuclease
LPSFPLYNDIGELIVTLKRCQSVRALTTKQRSLVDWFHNFIFTETLEFKLGSLTRNGCRVVLLNDVESSLDSSSRRTVSAASGINFQELELLKKNASKVSERNGKYSSDTDLLDSVVIESYLRSASHKNPGHYLVKSTGGNPNSRFPIQHVAKTYKEYFEGRYDHPIRNVSQPLLEVVHHSRRIDCRSKDCTRKNPRTMRLIPESLEFRSSPQSLTLRAIFLPVTLYRVDSLISMIELRDTLSTEMAASTPYDIIMPASPRKRARTSSNQASMKEAMSTLVRYFSPFDSSKTVPLFQLLEAVTCASSGDDFNLERLEMLGDSFLKMAVTIHVYWHKDHKDEGKLTKYRTRQISNKNLFNLARKRDLAKFIKLSSFSNKERWLPPGFISRKVENGKVLSDDDADDVMDDTNDIMDGEIPDDDVITQKIPDKSIADSMEALIGAHFIHCGYIDALKFMTWLGVDVFHSEDIEDEQLTNGNRRKSPTPRHSSNYANYPPPSFEIPADEGVRYREILGKQTKEMKPFEEKIGYTFNNKV